MPALSPPRSIRKTGIGHDREMPRRRLRIENSCAGLKEFRATAARHDKTRVSYAAAIARR